LLVIKNNLIFRKLIIRLIFGFSENMGSELTCRQELLLFKIDPNDSKLKIWQSAFSGHCILYVA